METITQGCIGLLRQPLRLLRREYPTSCTSGPLEMASLRDACYFSLVNTSGPNRTDGWTYAAVSRLRNRELAYRS